MGKNTVRFKCHHSGHCCTDVVCLPTTWDVIRIVKNTGADPWEFIEFLDPDEITGVEEDDATWLECGRRGKFIMALYRGKKGCFFLDKATSHCTIYEHRPLLCRLYPFCVQETRKGKYKGFKLHKDIGCPRHRDGVFDCKPLYKLYLKDSEHQWAYEELVEVFNKRPNKGKKPEHFIDMFIRKREKKESKE